MTYRFKKISNPNTSRFPTEFLKSNQVAQGYSIKQHYQPMRFLFFLCTCLRNLLYLCTDVTTDHLNSPERRDRSTPTGNICSISGPPFCHENYQLL